MKASVTILSLLICSILFTGCSKTNDVPETREAKVVRLLTSLGNRYWHLKEVYVNGVKQSLTDSQIKFTMTFTSDPSNSDPSNPKIGTFTDSDGFAGSWRLKDTGGEIELKYTNNPAGPLALTYTINAISETLFDIEYTNNQLLKSERKVFYAY
ncbi:MAG: hypothetical protein V4450_14285 [Bacteroidota bacterium]